MRQEDVADAGEGFQAFIMQCCRYIFDGKRQEVEGMDYAVFWSDRWLCLLGVVELDSVANADSLGGVINDCVTAVVVEG